MNLRALSAVGVLAALAAAIPAQSWSRPDPESVRPPARGDGPILACTADQLGRLREAFARGERAVTARVEAARARLDESVTFPPRGGQHNQWYQCDVCQRALTTIDATHHRCDGCGEVYSGEPYDDVVFSRVHGQNLRRARDAAWGYAVCGDPDLAADASKILLGYAARYRDYPYHSNASNPRARRDSGGHLKEQTLSEASMLVRDIAPSIDLIWPTLDIEDRAALLDGLVAPMVENIAKCERGRSNWQSWHNAAMFSAGVLLGDADWMRRSVFADEQGFLFQMGACVSTEGMWYENSWGYHLYTLQALAAHADAARNAGLDLFGHPTLRKMCALPARYVMADGALPRFGDDVQSSPARARAILEAALAATGDERIRAILAEEDSWDSLRYGRDTSVRAPIDTLGSEVLEGAGHGLLRQGKDERASSAAITFAPFGGFHDHFDRLSFQWYAHGTERGVDPGRAQSQAYRLPIHGQWYRATLSHNTVVVDGGDQRGAAGELLGFAQGEGWSAIAARTVGAWAGVEHRRCLILTEDHLIVLDHLSGDGAHTFDWVYHDRGGPARSPLAGRTPDGHAKAPLTTASAGFANWRANGQTDGLVEVAFGEAHDRTRVAIAAGGPTSLYLGDGPFRSVDDRLPLVLVRRRGPSAQFAAVLRASAAGATPIEARWDGAAVRVTVDGAEGIARYAWDGGSRIRRL